MWLLDHNLPTKLAAALSEFGIESANTYHYGWATLRNGELVASAYKAGFHVILTRDILFGQSAAKALAQHPDVAVVLLRLPQERGSLYVAAFKAVWSASPIVPQPGKFIEWGNS